MPQRTVGQVIAYQNGVRDGKYLLDDDYLEYPAQLMAIRVEKLLEEYQSPYQHIAIYDSTHHGKILVLDGFIQMTVADNFCYHEMITHVPMAVSQEEPNSVLVIGGGDGGVVNQLGKYQSLERIVWIDIDAAVVDLCRKYMPELHRFHDERVEFIAMDGADIDYQAEFDLIIVDGTDPIGGGESLWSKKFYTGLASALKPNGVITALGFWMWPDPHVYLRTRKMAEAHFEHTHYYWFLDPSMRYGYMGVILMTNNPLDPTVPQHLERVPAGLTEYYNGTVHTAAFALPNCFRPEAAFVPAEE